jgi:DNA-nicking Smr family endonuclease
VVHAAYSSQALKKKPFHAPFEKLAERQRQARAASPPPRPPPKSPPAGPSTTTPPPEPTEEELWARATAGASPVPAGADRVAPPAPRGSAHRAWYAELDEVDAGQAVLVGEPRFEVGPGEALLEGAVAGLDREVVKRLRRGDYAVEGRLDLHGLARDEARGAVERYLREARLGGKRCVLLVHGRGRHSADQLPVLKEALVEWLAGGRFGRQVLAFSSARPADGGAGALYVLLRRAGR